MPETIEPKTIIIYLYGKRYRVPDNLTMLKALEYCGYKTQLLEFIDFAHTPKNILIRATLRQNTPKRYRETKLAEVHRIMDEFHFTPTLYGLVVPESERNNA